MASEYVSVEPVDNGSSNEKRNPRARIVEQMKKLEFSQHAMEDEIRRLQKEMNSAVEYLKSYSQIKGHILDTMHIQYVRARKVVAASLAITLSSLAFGLRCQVKDSLRNLLPWTYGIGATSLAVSLIFSKDVWLSFQKKEWKEMTVAEMISSQTINEDMDLIDLMNKSHTQSLSFCSSDEEMEEHRRRFTSC